MNHQQNAAASDRLPPAEPFTHQRQSPRRGPRIRLIGEPRNRALIPLAPPISRAIILPRRAIKQPPPSRRISLMPPAQPATMGQAVREARIRIKSSVAREKASPYVRARGRGKKKIDEREGGRTWGDTRAFRARRKPLAAAPG